MVSERTDKRRSWMTTGWMVALGVAMMLASPMAISDPSGALAGMAAPGVADDPTHVHVDDQPRASEADERFLMLHGGHGSGHGHTGMHGPPTSETGDPERSRTAAASAPSCGTRAPHAPIMIEGDGAFQAGGNGVINPGAAGTPEDPFVIEGWCISSHGSDGAPEQGILLKDTTSHVLIRNNLLVPVTGFPNGIVLFGTTNAVIESNEIRHHVAGDGVLLLRAHQNTIRDNLVADNHRAGINLVSSTGNAIENNTVTRNQDSGILLERSHGNVIVGNTITENCIYRGSAKAGVFFDVSSGNTIQDNYIAGNAKVDRDGAFFFSTPGIWLRASPGNTFSGNQLEEGNGFQMGQRYNPHAPELEHFIQQIDQTNTVNGAPVHYVREASGVVVPADAGQVFVVNSTDVLIDGLEISQATVGVTVAFSERVVVQDSTFSNLSDDGVALIGTSDSLVVNNTMKGMRQHGVLLVLSSDNTVQGNVLEDIVRGGHGTIEVERGSSRNRIEANTISGAWPGGGGFGVIVYGGNIHAPEASAENDVIDNIITGTPETNEGIAVWESNHNRIQGNVVTDAGRNGIQVKLSSRGTIISGNVVTNSTATGIYVLWSSNTIVRDNHVVSNGHGGPHDGGIAVCCNLQYRDHAILNNTLADNANYGIYVSRPSDLVIEGNNIDGSRSAGLMVYWENPLTPLAPVRAANNWWGHASGPGPGALDPLPPLPSVDACIGVPTAGLGDGIAAVGSAVCFYPWLDRPNPEAGPV